MFAAFGYIPDIRARWIDETVTLALNACTQAMVPAWLPREIQNFFAAVAFQKDYRRNSNDVILSGKTYVRGDRATDQ